MKDAIDAFLSRRAQAWVDGVQPHATWICWLSVVMTLVLGAYAALTLGINSNHVEMVSDELPGRVAHAEFTKFFPNLEDALLIVIDGETTEQTRQATETLLERLQTRDEVFTDVYVPGGGSFFEQNGLLYRSLDELDLFADQMARIQAVLGQLEVDPTIASLSKVIRLGLDAVRVEQENEDEWAGILDQVGNATVTIFDEFPVAISWEEVLLRGSSIEVANRRVIIAHPILDFASPLAAGRSVRAIRSEAVDLGLVPERGVRVRVTGNPALNYEEMIGLAWDIGGAGVFCFLLVCGVLYRALRSFRLMVASVVTLLMGLVWTAAFAAFAVGQLNILSLTFAVLFIGLGIDFAIHLGMRYMNLLHRGVAHERAISTAAGDVGSSLVICTMTTAISFYVFLPSDYRGLGELGLIAGSGMFVILTLTLTTLPALLTCWLHLGDNHENRREVHFSAELLNVLAGRERWVRWASLAVGLLALGLIYRPGAQFDSNVVRMRNPATESVQAFDDLMSLAETSPWYANAVVADLSQAQELAESFRSLDGVERAITLSDFIPPDQEEKLEILEDVAMLLETPTAAPPSGPGPSVEEQIESLRQLEVFLSARWVDEAQSALGRSMRLLRKRIRDFLVRIETESDRAAALDNLEKVLLSNLPRQVQRLRDAVLAEEISREVLPDELVERMLTPSGQARVQIFPRENLQEEGALDRFVVSLREIDPYVSGVAVNLFDFEQATVSSFQNALALAFFLIALLLYGLWRNWVDVALVLAPLLLGATVTVATMAVLGIQFTFANVIVLPLLFGIGVDSGVHLVHRAKIRLKGDESLMGTTTARAVFYSAITTVTSFGTLAFSSHRGVAGLGVVLTIGMLLTVVCNLIVLPALIALRPEEPE